MIMTRFQYKLFLTNTLLLFVISLLFASTPKLVTFKTQQDFERGKTKGVSINGYGEIQLSPEMQELYKMDMPNVWSAVSDNQGNFFIAGGNESKVFKIDPDQKVSTYFEPGEKQIYALAVDGQGALFVATSPDGEIIKVSANGKGDSENSVFFDPEEIYIWSMLVDKQNNLYVATGEKGNIYKVDRSGKAELFYESDDAHIRKMIFDNDGSIVAGTSNQGLVLRVNAQGRAFVLYDSPLVEMSAIVQDDKDRIYFAVAGESSVQRGVQTAPPSQTNPQNIERAEKDEDVLELPVQSISASRPPRGGKKNSELYRIDSDGTVRKIWTPRQDRIFALTIDKSGNIIAGAGEPGRLYSVTPVGDVTLLNELEELQVTELVTNADNRIVVCTSNTGKVYALSEHFYKKGEYVSDVIDASVTAHWGAIDWEAESPAGTQLVFHTRSGNTEKPGKSWSGWSAPLTHQNGQEIPSPPARFMQYKAEFTTKKSQNSAVLKEVSFSYLQKNLAPEIRKITVHKPGDYYPESVKQAVENHLSKNSLSKNGGMENNRPGRKIFRKGARTVSWQANDGNQDDLEFDLFYKGSDENSWKSLVQNFHGSLYSWDSELLPDGRYFIKVVAADDVSNPPETVLTSEKISQPFKVDNTGPQVSEITYRSQNKSVKIAFVVKDALTSVRKVEYGFNADNWKLIFPVDGICDSKVEKFEIEVSSLVEGSNTIVIKAEDRNGNIGFGKTFIQF